MCGHTMALLQRIDTIPAASIEAYTSPTLGNTRLVDGRTCAPSKTLIGGTNVMVWLRRSRRSSSTSWTNWPPARTTGTSS